MFKKVLTYLTILAVTALPVQLISASVENLEMQMSMYKSMSQPVEAPSECQHGMENQQLVIAEKQNGNACCENQSHDCLGCDSFSNTSAVMLLFPYATKKTASLRAVKVISSHLVLTGIPQKNLLRPPRIIV